MRQFGDSLSAKLRTSCQRVEAPAVPQLPHHLLEAEYLRGVPADEREGLPEEGGVIDAMHGGDVTADDRFQQGVPNIVLPGGEVIDEGDGSRRADDPSRMTRRDRRSRTSSS